MYKIKYDSVKNYKYRLLEEYVHDTRFDFSHLIDGVNLEFINVTANGVITVRKGYSWDGASGPTWDTESTMRASLMHDVMYQLIRVEVISKKWQAEADILLWEIMREDSLTESPQGWWGALKNDFYKLRSNYYWQACYLFGSRAL